MAATLVVFLAGVAGAFACVSLATLTLSANSGPAGARIAVTGTEYSVVSPALPVVLRWNDVDGPELARATPNAKGEISATFTVPQGAPGYYVVIGVQRGADGQHRYGTPSRASYQILGPGMAPATTVPTSVTAAPATTSRPAVTTTATTVATPTSLSSTTSTSVTPVAAVPAAASGEPDRRLPAPAVAAAGVLLVGVAVALRRQAPGR
jgi:hypothetical protein